ncbi:MAG: peptidase [Peptococcaceae bacterium]|jgi:acetylornithine deacetylase/succinyl-diaminopimelate desuccinylase-like protein|nr:peptidase [Peptococcaceae bacterium]
MVFQTNLILDGLGNIIGHIKGKRPEKRLLFDGHMDTVPVPEPEKWQYPPYGGILDQGRIYGRGASDMKEALAAMICAMAFFAEDTDRGFAAEIIQRLAQEDTDFRASAFFAKGAEKCYTGKEIQGERFFPAWLER